jgi:fatty-acyl-CoA synthase
MKSTMQEAPLLLSELFEHGRYVHSESLVHTVHEDRYDTASFGEVADRAVQLAHALASLGVVPGDRVGTLMWNNQTHLESYLAIPSMGAVLHTLNLRLPPEQLLYVANHAEDKVIIVDASLTGLLATGLPFLPKVEHVIVANGTAAPELGDHLVYEELLKGRPTTYDWPRLDETDAAAMCYTSGTTGNPKGVAYSHRSTWLHSMAATSANTLGLSQFDSALAIVPMFHANAWGIPYAAWLGGSDLILPQQHMMGSALARIIPDLRPTLACGVPTIWNDFLQVHRANPVDTSSLRAVLAGGSAVPRTLIEAFEEEFGLPIVQGWGMTETSPLAALAIPPKQVADDPAAAMDYRVKAGRIVNGVRVRVVDDEGAVQPNDGESVGEFEIAGPWITASYYLDDDPEKFHDGWLRTGDVGTLDDRGFMTISDRTKDVIKSGGEWISSVELEGEVMAHPDVLEAAVIAVPDPRWQERPLVCVVPKPGTSPTPAELVAFLEPRVAKWWLPERWCQIDEIPKTSVGKFDKKVLRARFAAGELDVVAHPG